ncbi:MAG: right-handed parallel beta-helix repeat-containing protein [Bacilli bacterium]|nr:right-handed parallel beta-helix repeat-containing protein [Bacilli bacterium]
MKKKPLTLSLFSLCLTLTGCGENTSSLIDTSSTATEVSSVDSSVQEETSSSIEIVRKDLYASSTGTRDGDGSKENPYDFINGVMNLTYGSTLYLLGGTYKFNTTQAITDVISAEVITDPNPATCEEQRRTIQPAVTNGVQDKVVFDFSVMTFNSSNRGVAFNTDYWTFKDCEIFGAGDNGVYIGGNHNIIEHLDVHDCMDTGIQLGRKQSSDTSMETWPSYNTILNCTSHDNHDPSGEDSDGFACKLTTGVGNVFDGCIAYNNVDDGWDLYTKGDSGPIGPVTLRNCVAFNNGITSYGVGTANSDGNGFKLGGETIAVSHVVDNCIAFNNLATGFTDNSNPGTIRVTNCTSYNNGVRDLDANNFDFCRDTATSSNYFKNLLSYCDGYRISPIDGTRAKSNSRDEYKGTVSYSVFYSGLSLLKFTSIQDCDYTSTTKCGTAYVEPNGLEPFVSTTTLQPQAKKDVPAEVHNDIHSLYRDEEGNVKLGDFLKINPNSEFAHLGENNTALGADLSGGNK